MSACYQSQHVRETCCECGEHPAITHTRIVTRRGRGRLVYTCESCCPLCGCKTRQAATLEQTVASSQPAKRVSLAA